VSRDGGMVKLADFGVSAPLSATVSACKTVVGSPFWPSGWPPRWSRRAGMTGRQPVEFGHHVH